MQHPLRPRAVPSDLLLGRLLVWKRDVRVRDQLRRLRWLHTAPTASTASTARAASAATQLAAAAGVATQCAAADQSVSVPTVRPRLCPDTAADAAAAPVH